MTRFFALTLCLKCAFLVSAGQVVSISADSSLLIFPNNVMIHLQKPDVKNRGHYTLDNLALKTLLIQSNFLMAQANQSQHLSQWLTAELMIKDSVNQILQAQLQLERERVKNFSVAYVQLQSAAEQYDNQVRSLLKELAAEKKINRKQKRKLVVSGVLIGLGSATVVGVLTALSD